MSIYKLPFIKLYWSNNWLFAIPQFMMTIMTCHWYQQIKSHLYFIKPNEICRSKIKKLRSLLETFQQRCMSEWFLDCKISINKMMVLTKLIFSPIKIWINVKLIRDGVKFSPFIMQKMGISMCFLCMMVHNNICRFC
jgi:hypothetical protein